MSDVEEAAVDVERGEVKAATPPAHDEASSEKENKPGAGNGATPKAKISTTVRISNLSLYTTEEQIHEMFHMIGKVRRVVMGLNRATRTPAGFCFVEFAAEASVDASVQLLDFAKLDDRQIHVERDDQFIQGRQFSKNFKNQGRDGTEATEDASCWVEDRARDGRVMWQNVLTAEISWERPLSWAGIVHGSEPRLWIPCHDAKGLQYRHAITHNLIRPGGVRSTDEDPEAAEEMARDKMLRKRKLNEVMNEIVPDEEVAGAGSKYLLDFTQSEMKERMRSRQAFDHRKWLREFSLKENDDGSGELVRLSNNTVCNKLTADEADVFRRCPHIQQVFATGRPFIRHSGRFLHDERIANDDLTPRMKYHRRQREVKTVEMLGPRAELLAIIEFLSLHGHRASKVVYVGEPLQGGQAEFLSRDLFPDHHWVFIGPEPVAVSPSRRIEIMQTQFNAELAETFQAEDTLLVCVMKSGPTINFNHMMPLQLTWIQRMRPKAYTVKFQLPWDRGQTMYIDGDLHLPMWGGQTSVECRLSGTSLKLRPFDHTAYEQFMFYHNVSRRTTFFDHDFDNMPHCHCFDCRSELHILESYIKLRQEPKNHDRLEDMMIEMSKDVDSHSMPISSFRRG